jgi:hypothetical protein
VHGWIQEKTLPAAGFLPWDICLHFLSK